MRSPTPPPPPGSEGPRHPWPKPLEHPRGRSSSENPGNLGVQDRPKQGRLHPFPSNFCHPRKKNRKNPRNPALIGEIWRIIKSSDQLPPDPPNHATEATMPTTTPTNADPQPPLHDSIPTATADDPGLAAALAAAPADTTPAHRSKRTRANRANSRKSTGPKSDEGKRKVGFNALKHGMTAKSLLLPGEDPEALRQRLDGFKETLRPRNPVEDALVERFAHATWRAQRADRAIAARLTHRMLHADAAELAAEVAEVEDLTRRLYWDPRGPLALYPHQRGFRPTPRISASETLDDPLDPARIVHRLEMTVTGCRWLLDRWGELRRRLEAGLKWQGPDRFKAIRMLGRQPMDAADDERVLLIYLACDAMSPGEATSLADLRCETTESEEERLGARIQGRAAAGRRPASPEAGRAALLGLVGAAVRRLEILLEGHLERRERLAAVRLARHSYDETKEGELARRYERDCDRAVDRSANLFFRVRAELEAMGGSDSGPGGVAAAGPAAARGAGDGREATASASSMDGWPGPTEVIGEGTERMPAVAADDETERMPAVAADDETKPTAAVAADDETKPMPAVAADDDTKPTAAVAADDETKPMPAVAADDETKPTAAVAADDETEPMPAVAADDETKPTAAVAADDETEPMPAGREGEPACEPNVPGIPAGAGTPTGALGESSRLPAECEIGLADETKPTAAADPLGSRLEAAEGMGIPAGAGTPTGHLRESGLPAESEVGRVYETKPIPAGPPSAAGSDDVGSGDEAAGDGGSSLPAGGGPSSPGGADPVGPAESPPLPAIVPEALEAPARRGGELLASAPGDVRPPRAAQVRSPAGPRLAEADRSSRTEGKQSAGTWAR